MKDSEGFSLPGSERQLPPNAELVGPCPADTQIQVTVYLRSKDPSGLQEYVDQISGPGSHTYLTPQQFAHKFGADPADVEAVTNYGDSQQLQIIGHDLGRRSVTLSGTAARMNEAFGVNLQHYRYAGGVYRLRQGTIRIPNSFANIITGVFGLDNRPQAQAHFRVLSKKTAAPGAVTAVTYTPLQLAAVYDFPGGFTGQGETIGIIELGGGYNQTDLTNYFQQLGVSPAPTVTAVSIDGATNSPTGSADGPDGEVELDIEVAGSIAPGAAIKVFFAPNTDQGFIDAVTTAVNDSTVTLISISWGGPESTWTTQAFTSFNQAFQDAGTMGKTVFVAAGDSGSSDGETDGQNHVDFPASSPYVVGCGGTTLEADVTTNTITSEVVWNETASGEGATGGGVSDYFPKPSYQDSVNVPAPTTSGGGRGVPDVAADADPVTGYQVIIDGSSNIFGGTSAVAPLYAGLFARINQALMQQNKSRVGYVNAALYQNPSAFNDIVSGNNGAFSAGPGWDATTGLGSPDGSKILTALGG
ncbi:MAG: S53 family peptidase [Chthoniobacterales bacterium]